jgi:hypothetical protein
MGDGAVRLSAKDRLAIRRGDGGPAIRFRSRLTAAWRRSGTLEGRLKVTPELASAIGRKGPLQIDAPNEMGEPWQVGEAEPLKRIVRGCGPSR